MAAKRITVSLPPDVAARIKRAAGRDGSVSKWILKAALEALEADSSRERFCAWSASIPRTAADEKWAADAFEQIMGHSPAASRRKGRVGGKKAA